MNPIFILKHILKTAIFLFLLVVTVSYFSPFCPKLRSQDSDSNSAIGPVEILDIMDLDPNPMAELIRRYWELNGRNSSQTPNSGTYFTEPRLNDTAFNLWRPDSSQSPSTIFEQDDRILAQLVLGMEGFPEAWSSSSSTTLQLQTKTIFILNGFKWIVQGNLDQECPEYKLNKCRILKDQDAADIKQADLIISTSGMIRPSEAKFRLKHGLSNETKILYYILESPYVDGMSIDSGSLNDWVSSYWRDSDLTAPSDKWVGYDPRIKRKVQDVNYAGSKSKMAAIFVSNCHDKSGRADLIKKLQEFIPVDVYGRCGTLTCEKVNDKDCFEILRTQYKFYLAFENANCRDYITEKFFVKALRNDIVPVVFGARPKDYKVVAPFHSYIHVEDFNSVADLAQYLLHLDSNEQLYNQYFEWKGTGEFIDTKFFCRVCAMLHYNDRIPAPPNTEEFHWDSGHFCLDSGSRFWNKTAHIFT